MSVDCHLRYVSAVPFFLVPEYVTSDLRVGWTPSPRWGLEVVGRNLHEAHHLEFSGASPATSKCPAACTPA